MKWLKKNKVELVFGIGATLFLINFFTDQDPDLYVISIPLVVLGSVMLYKRHFRSNLLNSSFLGSLDDVDDDELYEDAKEAVLEAGKASTSYIQRKLRVGYSRAARLMDMLEEKGVIGPANGAEPRKVVSEKSNTN
jgi:DNA segregation ATPase FtsK/SpoIIIE-like protein